MTQQSLVNAHTHLELGWYERFRSRLPIPFHKWMKQFLRRNTNMRERQGVLEQYQQQSIRKGITSLKQAGITHVGDITLSGFSIEPLLESGLSGVVYIEILGLEEGVGEFMFKRATQMLEQYRPDEQNGLRIGLSAHAVYTTRPRTFRQVARYCQQKDVPLCIHAAEAPAEIECSLHGSGPLYDLPVQMGGQSHPYVPHKTPVHYLHHFGILDAQPLLAHVVHATDEELDMIAQSGAKIAHCPRSNHHLKCGRHPLEKALERNIPLALGTDSLATSYSLDVREEATFAHTLHEGIVPPEKIDSLLQNTEVF